MATSVQQQLHPYYPKTLELPGFAEATMTQSFILATFGSFSVILVFAVWAFAGLGLPFASRFCSLCLVRKLEE
jgi:hypothetical protein